MMTVVQVDGDLGVAERVIAARRCAVPEPHDCGFAVSIQDRWAWIHTVEAPDVALTEVRVEPVQAGSGVQFGSYMGRSELSPALMRRSVPFIRARVSDLLWRRAQWMVYRH